MTCRWDGPNRQRLIVGRHLTECDDRDQCPGCLPCAETHCYGDACRGRNHATGSCPDCLDAARTDLAAIVTMCGYPLLEEVLRSGVTSEAAMLLGPSADPEAWRNRAMSAMMGRLDAAYLEECRDEMHPLWVLGSYEQMWRDALDHNTDQRLTIGTAAAYLGLQMTYMAGRLEPPFDEFGRDLRTCRAHLERVLSDGEQIENGAPCPECDKPLVKHYGSEPHFDSWECSGNDCKVEYSERYYRDHVDGEYLRYAETLTATDMARQYRVKAGTLTGWATKGVVRKRGKDPNGRQLYDVADVVAMLAQVGA